MKRVSIIILALLCLFVFRKEIHAEGIEITTENPTVDCPLVTSLDDIDGEVEYKWYKDDELLDYSGSAYVPSASDYEAWIRVELIQDDEVIGSDEIYFSKLPVLYINTDDGEEITSKEEYKTGTMTTQGNSIYNESSQLYNGIIEIKGRGNSTWKLPKKPYKIKLDSKTDLLGMGKNKHWVLLANYFDECLMRNKIAYDFSAELGLVSMSSTWVDVILNGEYVGNYQLCEQIRIGDTRIDIYNWEDSAADIADAVYKKEKANGLSKTDKSNIEDQLCEDFTWVTSGTFTYNGTTYTISNYYTDETFSSSTALNRGYLFELSAEYDELTKFTTSSGLKVMVNSPEYLYTNSSMMSYVKNLWQNYENAYMSSTGYNSNGQYYTDIADLDSMVSYWLTIEIMGNNDAIDRSRYVYLDDDGILKWGPVWDFDYGMASNQGKYDTSATGWKVSTGNPYKYLITHDDFLEAAMKKYWEIRPQIIAITEDGGIFDTQYNYLYESGLANSSKWLFSRGFVDDSSIVKAYLIERTAWLDEQFSSIETLKKSIDESLIVYDYNVRGSLDSVSSTEAGTLKVTGWAYDADSPSTSIDVKIYIGTDCIGTITTNTTRSDVNSAYGITGKHGFSASISTTYSGNQHIVLRAVDHETGTECYLCSEEVYIQKGDTTSYTTNSDPYGVLDSLTSPSAGTIKVSGWAFDKDASSESIQVKVYIGSTCLGTLTTDSSRPDVNKAYGITGVHGYVGSFETSLTGTQTVTIKAVDLGTNKEVTIASKSVTITTSSTSSYTTTKDPYGVLDSLTSPSAGTIKVSGWAFDKDASSESIQVKVYIGSTCLGTLTANSSRPDVNTAYGITGNHGYAGSFTTTLTGTQTVTIKAVDLGTNKEVTIASKSVTISSSSAVYTTKYNPTGCIDNCYSNTSKTVRVTGWAFDKDASSESIQIKVYIGSTCIGTLTADETREDVNKAYSITGKHGFSGNLTTTLTGSRTVTIKAVNLGSGVEYTLGTKTITIQA